VVLAYPKFRPFVDLIALPLNHLVGFGFLMMATISFWWQRKFSGAIGTTSTLRLQRKELFLIVMTCVSLLLGSFVRVAATGNNDFGWRVLMLAHFAFLLWSAQYLANLRHCHLRMPQFNRLLLLTGIATCFYALYLDRTSALYCSNGERNFDIRDIYQKLAQKLPLTAIVQHRPARSCGAIELFAALYSHRQVVCTEPVRTQAMGGTENIGCGQDPEEYVRTVEQVSGLFDSPTAPEAEAICQRYKIDVLLVKDTDKLWSDRSSWVWKFPVIAENKHARAFLVRTALKS
jgi:hypothetical protein